MANVRVIPASVRKPDILRVAAYCRVSSNSEDQLHSYAAQIRNYTEVIRRHRGWKLIDVYADAGISGTSMKNRTQFNRMIAACKKGEIDLIYTKSLSRFARNTVECLEVVRSLKAMGIGIIFEMENIYNLENPCISCISMIFVFFNCRFAAFCCLNLQNDTG